MLRKISFTVDSKYAASIMLLSKWRFMLKLR